MTTENDSSKQEASSLHSLVSPPTRAEEFYRKLLEQIRDWPRNDRGRRLADSGLIFWDAMQAEKQRRANVPHHQSR